MPRIASESACATCLARKVKCDGHVPVCRNCLRRRITCKRRSHELRFVIHSDQPLDENPGRRSPTVSNQIPASSPPKNESDDCSHEWAAELASQSPSSALTSPEIASLFQHYITVLAPWYDLNDSHRLFGTVVPERALCVPILFKAIIAFSAMHWYRVTGKLRSIGPAFHTACGRELLDAIDSLSGSHGEYIASTCLLRSYEILDGDSRGNQRHLLGAYSFAVTDATIDLSERGLAQAGVWNYLREEITVGLECQRPVRICTDFPTFKPDGSYDDDGSDDDMKSNIVTYILALVINYCFERNDETTNVNDSGSSKNNAVSQGQRIATWHKLKRHLFTWESYLPASFLPFSTAPRPGNPFPSYWILSPWHVAGLQYASIAEILLALYDPTHDAMPRYFTKLDQHTFETIQEHTLRVCGLAYTNDDASARVNAFGPLSFCGRFLLQPAQRKAVEEMLLEYSIPTAWPVHHIIRDLKDYWELIHLGR
ncbi:hypothetical protein L228DRAFT_141531 [Xylona heveae TC161]|uniref:Zn(2)-C6 fungal-type domain-containing protein n=1 Tax=Xylona heveae (strain CBS 132557 / TC161) TaxID=1328760 RepID=A0A165H5N4_XYLHT|nr:hypothetical protein L228DRAFT_141531 [Xylona heveae TC161]KZF23020.1 hypothetical protein L228DRAFT_141531 [Xylona heveae TC161]